MYEYCINLIVLIMNKSKKGVTKNRKNFILYLNLNLN